MTNERAQHIVDASDDESAPDSIAPPPIDRADQESQLEGKAPLGATAPVEDGATAEPATGADDLDGDEAAELEATAEVDEVEALDELIDAPEDDEPAELEAPERDPEAGATDLVAEDVLSAEDAANDEDDDAAAPAEDLPYLLEALLFVADEPIAPSALGRALGVTPRQVRRGLDDLADTLREENRGVRLQQGPDGAQLVTAPEAANAVELFLGLEANRRLSNAALETLAIIAYRQPVTRHGIEQIRGVSSDGAVATLRARGLIEGIGRAPGPGRPLLFATTQRFLEHFGLERPDELPPLPEDVELPDEEGAQLGLDGAVDASEAPSDAVELDGAAADDEAPRANLDGAADEDGGEAEVIEDALDTDEGFEPFQDDEVDGDDAFEDDTFEDDADLEISDDLDDLSRAAGAALAAPSEPTGNASADA